MNSFCKCKSYSHFFSKNIRVNALFNDQSFNDTLTNEIVSFEQLGPDKYDPQRQERTLGQCASSDDSDQPVHSAVWSESSLGALLAKGAKFLHADNKDSDQIARVRRMIWVCVWLTSKCPFSHIAFYMKRAIYCGASWGEWIHFQRNNCQKLLLPSSEKLSNLKGNIFLPLEQIPSFYGRPCSEWDLCARK